MSKFFDRINDMPADDFKVVWQCGAFVQERSKRIGVAFYYLDQTAAQARHPDLKSEPSDEQLNINAFVLEPAQAEDLMKMLYVGIEQSKKQ